MTIGIAAAVTAQVWVPPPAFGNRNWPDNPQRQMRQAESVTVTGNLIVAHGMPAIKTGDLTYLIMGTSRLIGFIEGFKEGAQVSIEGTAIGNPQNENLKFLRPVKMTLGGKSYDLASPINPENFLRNRLARPEAQPRLPQQGQPRQQLRPQLRRDPPPPQYTPRNRNAPPPERQPDSRGPQMRQRQL